MADLDPDSPGYLYALLESTIFTEGLDEMDLGALGFAAVWIRGADLATLASEFGLDLATREPCRLSEILDHHLDDGSRWVAQVGEWICVVPAVADGDDAMRSLTAGGREAVGFSMDIGGHDYVRYARDGRLITAFECDFPSHAYGDDPHALDHLMSGLRFQLDIEGARATWVESDESIGSALTLIGRLTGADMASEWLLARHTRLRPS
ncbi:DUF6461 domain-containing protein [Herbidospora cretacea]|uniref:DUF6461 domain-containing protein n=1 Tax=Herbidospora cretacea TaxID=28444 RepID=UPI0004C4473C|nr:DUF6461 domain-containing protein [Herbidospora cretacea]